MIKKNEKNYLKKKINKVSAETKIWYVEELLTSIALIAYSTWNKRPSGEKVFTPRS